MRKILAVGSLWFLQSPARRRACRRYVATRVRSFLIDSSYDLAAFSGCAVDSMHWPIRSSRSAASTAQFGSILIGSYSRFKCRIASWKRRTAGSMAISAQRRSKLAVSGVQAEGLLEDFQQLVSPTVGRGQRVARSGVPGHGLAIEGSDAEISGQQIGGLEEVALRLGLMSDPEQGRGVTADLEAMDQVDGHASQERDSQESGQEDEVYSSHRQSVSVSGVKGKDRVRWMIIAHSPRDCG